MRAPRLFVASLVICGSMLAGAGCNGTEESDKEAACEEELSLDPACGDSSDEIAECVQCWEDCGHPCRHTVPLCNPTFSCSVD